jgi:hypothetical protein
MEPPRRKCSATTRRGTPCRRWATRSSNPPRCPAHAACPAKGEAETAPGFYLTALTPQELDHFLRPGDLTLDEEISLARACLLRVAEALKANGSLTPEQRIRLASLIFRGASTIARLLRERQAVSGEPGDSLSSAIGQALGEVARELGVEP